MFARALAELASALGLDDLAFDDEGLVNLEIDGLGDLGIYKDEASFSLVFAGIVAPASEEQLSDIAACLLAPVLAAVREDAPFLGYNEDAELLMAYLVHPLREAQTTAGLGESVAGFIEYLDAMRRLVAEPWEEPGPPEDKAIVFH